MGDHGALMLALKTPGMFKSVSAFTPIANPSLCSSGQKEFRRYFGEDNSALEEWDPTELVKKPHPGEFSVLIDVGTSDEFYKRGLLLPENFEEAAKKARVEV
jgi:S-formylglutathione hydrolase